MWQGIKAACLNSVTIAWSYILAIAGAVMEIMDNILDIVNDPSLKDAIHGMVGDTKVWGWVILGISIITIIARMRTLRKVP